MQNNEIKAISQMLAAIGNKDFGLYVDSLVNKLVCFDMSCILLFSPDRPATMVHDGYKDTVSRKAITAYLRGGYLLDPYYVACINNHSSGLWRMSELAPDSFYSSGFIMSKSIHPCVSSEEGMLVEEVGFIITLKGNLSAVYSLMRNAGNEPFSIDEFMKLKSLEPIVQESISKHIKYLPSTKKRGEYSKKEKGESQFIDVFQDRLTPTQRDVAKLILRGHSVTSIALNMNITEGTAKLHKANLYKRLSISTQAELFRMFIDYLTE
ncbi:hypothetical protein EHLJMEHL_00429 [Vreelandella titanicae]